MKLERAYSTLEIKQVGGAGNERTFTGIASTATPDRMGDIVEPKGAQFKLPIPLLWQHDSGQPIGWVTSATVKSDAIEIVGKVAEVPDEGTLRARLEEAWQSITSKLVRGLSIGFRPLESSDIEGSRWAQRFIKWEWLELSAVTIPANVEATIVSVKSFDKATRAALGLTRSPVVHLSPPPGAAGTKSGRRPGVVYLNP